MKQLSSPQFGRQPRTRERNGGFDYMIKILPYSLMLLPFITGCGPQFYQPESQGKPAQIVVSAYTQDGCLEELQQEAKNRGVEVKLANVETNLGLEILVFPFYKGYKCTGEVTGPAKSTP
jgi:hypothetical protein